MLSCKDATRLLSRQQERRLSLRERLSLKMHLMICYGCKNYGRQIDFIRAAFQRIKRD